MAFYTQNKKKKTVGFTLIELLVVIAIIAILAAILFPVFAQVREKARQTACLSNEKQIGLGIIQYTQDYDETLPIAYYGAKPDPYYLSKWMDMIYPYVKSQAVFTCPSRVDATGNNSQKYVYVSQRTTRTYGTYFLNGTYSGDTANVPDIGVAGAALAGIDDPTGTVFVLEAPNPYSKTYSTGLDPNAKGAVITFDVAQGNPSWVKKNHSPVDVTTGTGTSEKQLFVAPHQGLTNAIFCDGHAKSYDPATLLETHSENGKTVAHMFTPESD